VPSVIGHSILDSGDPLPHRVGHEDLAIARRGHDPRRNVNSQPTEPPIVIEGRTPDNAAGFVANVICSPEEARQLAGGLGFIFLLHVPRQMSDSEMREELMRIVTSHDKEEIDHLLLTVGGPDRQGIRYPAEEVFGALLVQRDGLEVTAEHLDRVTLHLWSDAQVHEIRVRRP
jgi:hypothetical protein